MADYSFASILDDSDARIFFRRLEKKLEESKKNLKELAIVLSGSVFKDILDHFKSQSSPDGPWVKWSDSYADHMRKIGKGGNKILQDTGTLRQSLQPDNGKTKTMDGAIGFLTSLEYANTHDKGDKRRNIPQRQFMWLSEQAMEDISNKTLKWLLDEK